MKRAVPLIVCLSACGLACSHAKGADPETTSLDGGADSGVDLQVIDPEALAAPPSGQGFQLKVPFFQISPGTEEQDCYFFQVKDVAVKNGLPADKPVNLHRLQVAQKAGSHHMNLFRVKTILALDPKNGAVQKGTNGNGECFKSPNWSDWPLIGNTQQRGEIDWTYPDGVANVFQPDEWIMLQTHYVNAASQKSPEGGEVAANFWTMSAAEVKAELGTVFATKQSIRICSQNPSPTFSGTCQINSPTPVTIIGANGHFHGRGRQFDIFSWDGTSTTPPEDSARFYQSVTWDDPPMLHSPQLNVQLPAKAGIWYSCGFEWTMPDSAIGGCEALNAYDEAKYLTPKDQQDCCYTFGPIVEKNEHCNAFVYYYPKRDNVNCY